MADQYKPKTAEDIEKELSVGNFAKNEARALAFTVGGAALGWVAGKYGLAKMGLGNKVGKWITAKDASPEHIEKAVEISNRWIIPGVSAAAGYVVGQIAALYEHWVKVERERLSVQEINNDVAHLMDKRVQFEETIDKQHTIVKDLLAKHKSSTGHLGEKILSDRETASAEITRS